MRKYLIALIIAVIMVIGMPFLPTRGEARVNVNVDINVPVPPFVFPAPPHLVPLPGLYAYYVPGIDVDILFYHGYWYRPVEGHWYRAHSYKGPWRYLDPPRVPGVFHRLPRDFRHVPPGHQRIPYREVNSNWKKWERERHWDRENGRGNRGRDEGSHRGHEGGEGRGRGHR